MASPQIPVPAGSPAQPVGVTVRPLTPSGSAGTPSSAGFAPPPGFVETSPGSGVYRKVETYNYNEPVFEQTGMGEAGTVRQVPRTSTYATEEYEVRNGKVVSYTKFMPKNVKGLGGYAYRDTFWYLSGEVPTERMEYNSAGELVKTVSYSNYNRYYSNPTIVETSIPLGRSVQVEGRTQQNIRSQSSAPVVSQSLSPDAQVFLNQMGPRERFGTGPVAGQNTINVLKSNDPVSQVLSRSGAYRASNTAAINEYLDLRQEPQTQSPATAKKRDLNLAATRAAFEGQPEEIQRGLRSGIDPRFFDLYEQAKKRDFQKQVDAGELAPYTTISGQTRYSLVGVNVENAINTIRARTTSGTNNSRPDTDRDSYLLGFTDKLKQIAEPMLLSPARGGYKVVTTTLAPYRDTQRVAEITTGGKLTPQQLGAIYSPDVENPFWYGFKTRLLGMIGLQDPDVKSFYAASGIAAAASIPGAQGTVAGAVGSFARQTLNLAVAFGSVSMVSEAVAQRVAGKQTSNYQTGAQVAQVLTGSTLALVGLYSQNKEAKLGLPTLQLESLTIPVSEGKAIAWRGITVEAVGKGWPVVGVKEGRLVFGTKPINLAAADLSRGFIVETPAQTRIIAASIDDYYGGTEAAKFGLFRDIVSQTETTPSAFVRGQFIKETKTLSPEGVGEVIKFTKEQGGLLYGSFPSRSQMPKDLARVAGDIDIQLSGSQQEAEAAAQVLVGRLRLLGEDVRVSPDKPSLVQVKIRGETYNAVDIHSAADALSDLSSPSVASKRAFGFALGQEPVSIEGVRTMPLSEQGVRKGASIFTLRTEGLGPASHRLKDIPDFFAVQEALIRSKRFGQQSLMTKLGELKSYYPEELFGRPSKVNIPVADELVGGSSSVRSVAVSQSLLVFAPGVSSVFLSPLASVGYGSQSFGVEGSVSVSASASASGGVGASVGVRSYPVLRSSPLVSVSPSLGVSPSWSVGVYDVRSPVIGVSPSPSLTPSPSISPPSLSPPLLYPPFSPSVSLPPGLPSRSVPPRVFFGDDGKKGRKKAFKVLVRRRGKFVNVASGLPLGRALEFGQRTTLKSLAATFKVVESGETDLPDTVSGFRPDQRLFRSYEVRRGKAVPFTDLTFIQKRGKRLASGDERLELSAAARQRRNTLRQFGL